MAATAGRRSVVIIWYTASPAVLASDVALHAAARSTSDGAFIIDASDIFDWTTSCAGVRVA